jgi:hypothetical protein
MVVCEGISPLAKHQERIMVDQDEIGRPAEDFNMSPEQIDEFTGQDKQKKRIIRIKTKEHFEKKLPESPKPVFEPTLEEDQEFGPPRPATPFAAPDPMKSLDMSGDFGFGQSAGKTSPVISSAKELGRSAVRAEQTARGKIQDFNLEDRTQAIERDLHLRGMTGKQAAWSGVKTGLNLISGRVVRDEEGQPVEGPWGVQPLPVKLPKMESIVPEGSADELYGKWQKATSELPTSVAPERQYQSSMHPGVPSAIPRMSMLDRAKANIVKGLNYSDAPDFSHNPIRPRYSGSQVLNAIGKSWQASAFNKSMQRWAEGTGGTIRTPTPGVRKPVDYMSWEAAQARREQRAEEGSLDSLRPSSTSWIPQGRHSWHPNPQKRSFEERLRQRNQQQEEIEDSVDAEGKFVPRAIKRGGHPKPFQPYKPPFAGGSFKLNTPFGIGKERTQPQKRGFTLNFHPPERKALNIPRKTQLNRPNYDLRSPNRVDIGLNRPLYTKLNIKYIGLHTPRKRGLHIERQELPEPEPIEQEPFDAQYTENLEEEGEEEYA